MRSRGSRWWVALLATVSVLLAVAGCSATAAPPAPTVTVTQTVTAAPVPGGSPSPSASWSPGGASGAPTASRAPSGLPTVAAAELPPEAQRTLALIATGGPFPYSKDGATFYNREGLLPPQTTGYYREYTVDTPGSDDRGARRIVAGGGVAFYTDDHYNSFREVIP